MEATESSKQKQPMKKIKKLRIVFAVLTLVFLACAVFAVQAVWGDKLLSYNSTLGALLSVSYRWILLILIVLVFIDMVLAVISRKKACN